MNTKSELHKPGGCVLLSINAFQVLCVTDKMLETGKVNAGLATGAAVSTGFVLQDHDSLLCKNGRRV